MTILYPQVPLEEWSRRYRISLTPLQCRKCGAERKYTRPYALPGYRGVQVERPCPGCKDPSLMTVCVPVGQALELWEMLRP